MFKFATVGAAAVSMLTATGAMAAGPASAPAVARATTASSLRTATPLRHKSNQSDSGTPAVGYVLAGIVGVGIVAATIAATDDDNGSRSRPSSPG